MHPFFLSTLSYLSRNDPAPSGRRRGPPPFRRDNSERAMQVQVETFVDEGGVEKLRRFYLNGRQVEVGENLDQWHGADYRYFKVRGSEGDVYILYLDVLRTQWALTMYQRSQSPDSRDAM